MPSAQGAAPSCLNALPLLIRCTLTRSLGKLLERALLSLLLLSYRWACTLKLFRRLGSRGQSLATFPTRRLESLHWMVVRESKVCIFDCSPRGRQQKFTGAASQRSLAGP